MHYVISYDVSDDRRRNRLSAALQDCGSRVQLSVFECELDEAELAELRGRIEKEIDAAEDSCRIYRLCAACKPEIQIIGRGERYEEPPFVIV